MKLHELIDPGELQSDIERGYIRVSKNDTLNLRVYCYTEAAIYDCYWTGATRWSRGLVVGPDDEIVAWCMPKFFSAADHIAERSWAPALPNEPFQIFRKADGSLGTVFHYAGEWRAATKGGFQSSQAQWAQQWLDKHDLTELNPKNTYVTEIIYPENRIVVDNGVQRTLTLLTVYGPDGQEKGLTGHGQAWERLGGTVVQEFPAAKLSRVLFYAQRNQEVTGKDIVGTQAEGYVLRYSNGLRVKVKFPDYVRLHGIVTGLTERHVWEILREGGTLDALFETLPDEYHDWLVVTESMLRSAFRTRATRLTDALRESRLPADPREFKQYAEEHLHHPGLFALYDLISQQTWEAIKPAAVGPWKDHE